ncbi:hypothetical protein ACQKP8_26830 [Photobacterium alginatilyticum]|uniref:hypothetical protein n=1 Tax=Photobacterium alginatilyticum TaxID=1775171 RepID=UPI0040686A65
MIKMFIILILFFIPSVYAELPAIGEKNVCTISINGSQQVTPLSAPCSWAVNSDSSLQIRNVNNEAIAILVGKPIDPELETEWGVTKGDLCSFESVGVVLDNSRRQVAISKPMKDALVCPSILIDDVFFMSYRWE